MNRRKPYHPQLSQIPADPLRGGLCDTCDPRRFPRDPRRHSPPAHPILNSELHVHVLRQREGLGNGFIVLWFTVLLFRLERVAERGPDE